MAYRSRSRRYQRRAKSHFLVTILIIIGVLWVTFTWILPPFIDGLGKVTGIFKNQKIVETPVSQNSSLAPPVLNIPYEATNSARIDIHGFATSGSKVKIYLDDVLTTTTEAGEDGSFTAKSLSLSLGTNNIYGKTEDQNNKISLQSKTISLVYDSEKPHLEVSSPTDGQTFTGERKITVAGKSEPNAIVTVNGDQAIVDSEGKFSKQISLADGSNTLTIKTQDRASNFTQIQRNVTFNP